MLPFIFEDECAHSPQEALSLHRHTMRFRISEGWFIGEAFDERYDTEVGGTCVLVTQSLEDFNAKGEARQAPTLVEREACIIDYGQDGKRYTEQQAHGVMELGPVLRRLLKRKANYAEHLAQRAARQGA
jgi:hypothetical protein